MTRSFHARRRAGIGSTDSAAIIGVSKWKTAYQVWVDKTQPQPERGEPTIPQWMGLALQKPLLSRYASETGRSVRPVSKQYSHPVHKFIKTHIDGLAEDRIVEIKTARSNHGWTDQPPIDYWIQVQHQMLVLGMDKCDVYALIGGYETLLYTVDKNDEFCDGLVEALVAFWNNHVLTGIPPEVDASEAASAFLVDRHPRDNGLVKVATPEQEVLADLYRKAKSEEKLATEQVKLLRNRLCEIIGDDLTLVGPGFEIKWVTATSNKAVTDWKSIDSALRNRSLVDTGVLDALINEHTTTDSKSHRMLVTKWKEDNE